MGAVMVWPARHPIQKAAADAGLAPGPSQPDLSADEFMKRLGSLPLIHQPGERWLYHTGCRRAGRADRPRIGPVASSDFLHERLFEPLGMRDTGFQVPADKLGRLASAYMMDPQKKDAHLLRRRRATAAGAGRPPSPPAARAWSRPSTTISPSAA